MGRIGKYTPEIVDKLCERIRTGVPLRWAAIGVGINESTFWAWMQEKEGFSERVRKAESDAVAFYVSTVAKAANKGNYKAAMFWLERRLRDDFGQKIEAQIDQRHLILEVLGVAQADVSRLPGATEHLPEASPQG